MAIIDELAAHLPEYWPVWTLFAIVVYLYLIKPQDTTVKTFIECRNLLNKKEGGPPSTIKESSESSQTLDDTESDKGE
ncbi:hypothetical protein Y032_0414g1037 [Ancylostoma ceylanicum]|uniref:Uncharacterized protein n=1 Tax=Ancylostoma ceylanicum TaxID=53326 RepID=A0A016X3Q5_9BILA|nr:hypothetical protein Y032_0414g1037 [Ancylostoma ceylanicum]